MDPTKLAGIKTWPQPKTKMDIRSFLGFGNFYQKFIRHYAELAAPLHDLTKKEMKVEWMEVQDKAFKELKERFLEEPVL